MSNSKTILIVGLGQVGQPLAVKLAQAGYQVRGVDGDKRVVEGIRAGKSHIGDPELNRLILKHLDTDRFVAIPDPEAATEVDIIILCVPSDYSRTKQRPDLASLKKAAGWVATLLRPGQLVIVRTTVPIGVTRTVVLPLLEKSGLKADADFSLAYCPERTVEGAALKELSTTPQIVGGLDGPAAQSAREVFSKIAPHVVVLSSLEAAEAVKLVDNTYRDYRFAFANIFAHLCEQLGLNSHEVIKAANFEYPRNSIPVPSPGVGGSCLPKDSYFLSYSARRAGISIPLVMEARQVNEITPIRLVQRIARMVPLSSATIFVAGFAFKGVPQTNDMRESPTLALVEELKRSGADITGYDPAIKPERISAVGATPMETLESGLECCDVCVFMTNHAEFASLSVERLAEYLKPGVLIVDGWYQFDPEACMRKGFKYLGVGVG